MEIKMGIRREDKNRWERRTPLIPEHVEKLREEHGIQTIVQTSPIRVFLDEEYQDIGATVQEDISPCPVIFAIKEIPVDFLKPGKTYVFFSHTIKGQKYNMPMLRKMMDLGCTLIDYERIVDKNGRRLVFFGRFAGLAGMIDTLWAFGQRLLWEKVDTVFKEIKQTIYYNGLPDIRGHLVGVKRMIESHGFPEEITPMVVGFAGYGNVSKGAQEILDLLPVKEVQPGEIKSIYENPSNKCIYKVVFKEEHMAEPISPRDNFDLQDYYRNPGKYRGVFEKYIPYLSILMNCIYWDKQYPRLLTKKYLKNLYASHEHLHLKAIGDISVDINGAIEFTEKTTSPDNPVFLYDPINDTVHDGYKGNGVVVMTIDNLPCELPRESSQAFSEVLSRFVPEITKADFSVEDFDKLDLPFEIKNAVILYHGRLTPNYSYINRFL